MKIEHKIWLTLTLLCFVTSSSLLIAQESYHLQELQNMVKENYPLLKQKNIIEEIAANKQDVLNANYLPQVNLTAQSTLQSEVTSFDFQMPGVSGFKQKPDQYSMGLELKQSILDYGAVGMQKKIEHEITAIQLNQIDADLLKLNDKVNQLVGSVLLYKENRAIIKVRIEDLSQKLKKIIAAYEQGAALKSACLLLESEQLVSTQKLQEINFNLVAAYKGISLLSGKTIDTSATLYIDPIAVQSTLNRPELASFDMQMNVLKMRESMLVKNNLPKLFVFARGYYGRPGFNFLNNDFRPYGLVGTGLSWGITNYYTSGKERKNLRLTAGLAAYQKKAMAMNIELQGIQQLEEINKLHLLISSDEKIVEAKKMIRMAASSQLENGTITPADYLTELNSENQAQLQLKLHQIQLLMAQMSYNNTLGY